VLAIAGAERADDVRHAMAALGTPLPFRIADRGVQVATHGA
jgi:hypothetical protein